MRQSFPLPARRAVLVFVAAAALAPWHAALAQTRRPEPSQAGAAARPPDGPDPPRGPTASAAAGAEAPAAAPTPSPAPDPDAVFQAAVAAYARVRDYTAVFHKREFVDGKLLPEETILLKFRKPFSVYMKWVKDPYKGREILYEQGKNEGRLKAHEGGLLGVVSVNLDPKGSMAMKGNRHAVTEVGIGNILDIVGSNLEKARMMGGLRVEVAGEETVYGRPTLRLDAHLPPGKGLYCGRAILHIDRENHLPIRVAIHDEAGRLVEQYGFENLRLNVGLTDRDFDPENPDYDF